MVQPPEGLTPLMCCCCACSTAAGRAMSRGELLREGLTLAFYGNTQQWQFVAISLGLPLAVYLLLLLLQRLRTSGRYHGSTTFVGHHHHRASQIGW
jgi:hypothetical protein